MFPAVTGSGSLGAAKYDNFARENYVYAACGNPDRIELALVTGIYVAKNRADAAPLPGFDARKVLKKYLQLSFAWSLAGTCPNEFKYITKEVLDRRISLNFA